ncbi:RNA polymerase sigma factor [Ectobacillus ponti]|uniref:Sigma-70 family RNA polymerase sigma factor n=1 Tax=Ectobacillus ponti TaxID=2961894 RepID=A0AA41XA51_9BACI|nr:sigma-70 family RNA polymerase sigma factor [Ectobacillus ponti]MCP8969978.1 sigma-70 family RNA polymerase sigma factor [Ectobacillus ponti]
MNDQDVSLYQSVLQGDRQALEQLYDKYEKLLFSFAYRMTGRKELAEEAVQDVFLKLWTKKGLYDSTKGKFSSWLLTITRNASIDLLRKNKQTLQMAEVPEALASQEPGVEELVEWKEEGARLREAMSELGEEQKAIVDLFYFQAMSQQSIADVCQIPLGTVKGRIRLALQHLRKHLLGREGMKQ